MTWQGGESPRGFEGEMTRGLEEMPQGPQFARGSLEQPLESERALNQESERAAQVVERSEGQGGAFSREGGDFPAVSGGEFQRDGASPRRSKSGVNHIETASDVADVFELPMRKGLYGVTKMDTYPFKIMINSRVLKPRQLISLVHEMLHVFMKLHKMDEFPHSKLHDLAIFINSEILPVIERFRKQSSS